MKKKFDVCIIGGGYLGCLIADELSLYGISVLVIEQEPDVCRGIAKANTAVLYAGYDNKPGTRKSEFAVRGNRETKLRCEALGVKVQTTGSIMVGTGPRSLRVLEKKLEQGRKNQVPELRLLNKKELDELEPGLGEAFQHGLYAKTTGTFYPWELGIAAIKRAEENGAIVWRSHKLNAIARDGECYALKVTEFPRQQEKQIHAAFIVNAAGMNADKVRELLLPPRVRIYPTKGDYLIYEPEEAPRHIIFYEPEEKGKGIVLVPGSNGTLLAGPSERDFNGPSGTETTIEGINFVKEQAEMIWPLLKNDLPIRNFAAMRPNPYEVLTDESGNIQRTDRSIHDLIIDIPEEEPGFVSLVGIKTPGLTAGVPIAEFIRAYICERLSRGNKKTEKTNECKIGQLSVCEKIEKSKTDHTYGKILCECEQITYGEVLDAIENGATDFEGVKRRTGAGFGTCQGSRCRVKIEALIKEKQERSPFADEYRAEVQTDYLIVGGGIAGLSLALEMKKQKPDADVLIIEKENRLGGVLNQCSHKGFRSLITKEFVTGTALSEELRAFIRKDIAVMTGTCITAIAESDDGELCCQAAADGKWILVHAKQVILATGALEKTAGMLGIPGTRPEGVFTAGELQYRINVLGETFCGKRAVVVGAGNMGLIISDMLRNQGAIVPCIVEMGNKIGANVRNKEQYTKGVNILLQHKIAAVHGEKSLQSVTVERRDTEEKQEIPCDLLVLAGGLLPDRKLLKKLDTETLKHVWCFGNCDHIYQVVDSICQDAKLTAKKLLT